MDSNPPTPTVNPHIESIARSVIETIQTPVDVTVVLGSGLGAFIEDIPSIHTLATSDIPDYPTSTVAGHAGKLTLCEIHGKNVLFFSGRLHAYEGYSIADAALPAYVATRAGARLFIATNAAGGLNPQFSVGDLMLIKDHLVMPMAHRMGLPLNDLGSMDRNRIRNFLPNELLDLVLTAAMNTGIVLREGIYGFCSGPTYETRAEIAFFRKAGADAVGMSTVPEFLIARQSGMQCLGLSCITNKAITVKQQVTHREVTDVASKVSIRLGTLITEIIGLM